MLYGRSLVAERCPVGSVPSRCQQLIPNSTGRHVQHIVRQHGPFHSLMPHAMPQQLHRCKVDLTARSHAASVPQQPGQVPPGIPPHIAQAAAAAAAKAAKQHKTPMQQQILNGILGISNVPYSSFVPTPVTFLHKVDARVKQVWLVALYFMIARATPGLRVAIAATIALVTVAVLPRPLWQSQLSRLGMLCFAIFASTALGADGVPSVLQTRAPPPGLEGLPPVPRGPYHYVILHIIIITVTHRSVNMGITAAALTFCALQSASLCLVTTPGEEMATALRWWLTPLGVVGVPVKEVALTLLLSLRFMSLVFEEVKNLALGLAARGVDWSVQGWGGSMLIATRLLGRLFANLMHRSDNIAQAMSVRGFQGPENQRLYMMRVNETSAVANIAALGLLGVFAYATSVYR